MSCSLIHPSEPRRAGPSEIVTPDLASYNMPESLQSSDRGTAAEEAVSHLDTALEALDEIANQASEATEALDSAMA